MSRNKKTYYRKRKKAQVSAKAEAEGFLSFGIAEIRIPKKEEVVRDDLFEMIPMYTKQQQIISDENRFVITEATTKAGKALRMDALLYTPQGPILMGDVKVGDELISVDGTPTNVIGVYPQGVKDHLKITFKDGASTICSDDHLWEISVGGKTDTVSAAEMLNFSETKLNRTKIPVVGTVQFKKRPYTLDPYLAGTLIGDGCFSVPKSDRLIAQLKLMNLFGKLSYEKHIPKEYIYNSEEVRLKVLQGIFDTDGYVDRHGQPRIEQTSEQLAKDITEIVESLGGTVRLTTRIGKNYTNGKGGRKTYRLGIQIADGSKLFSIPRKKLSCRKRKKPISRVIASIERVVPAECQCIAVDHPRRLFATDRFVMTHNTASHIEWLLFNAVNSGGGIWWWVAPVGNQAKMAFDRCKERLRGYMEQKRERVKVGEPIPFKDNISDRVIYCNGAQIVFKSSDNPDSLYGEEVRGAVCDEISRWKPASWTSVYSTLTSSQGKCRLIGNVTGKRNFAHILYLKAKEGQPNWAAYTLTALDAIEGGVISKEVVDQARADLSEHEFAMLYMAEALDDGHNPFGHANIDKIAKDTRMSKLKTVVFGIDFARKRDYTVIVGLDRNGSVTQIHRFQDEWDQQIAKVARICKRVPALIDSTGGGDVLEAWLRFQSKKTRIQGFIFGPKSKQTLMEGLALDISEGGWTLPKDSELYHELMDFEMNINRSGNVKYEAPYGLNDDCVCALALAREAFKRNRKDKLWWMTNTTED